MIFINVHISVSPSFEDDKEDKTTTPATKDSDNKTGGVEEDGKGSVDSDEDKGNDGATDGYEDSYDAGSEPTAKDEGDDYLGKSCGIIDYF